MCSKKDYVAIAAIIKKARVDGDGYTMVDYALTKMAKDLCVYFQTDNPGFDCSRFMKAVRG